MHKGYEEAIHREGSSIDELLPEEVLKIIDNRTTWATVDTSECRDEKLENARCLQEKGLMGAPLDC